MNEMLSTAGEENERVFDISWMRNEETRCQRWGHGRSAAVTRADAKRKQNGITKSFGVSEQINTPLTLRGAPCSKEDQTPSQRETTTHFVSDIKISMPEHLFYLYRKLTFIEVICSKDQGDGLNGQDQDCRSNITSKAHQEGESLS
jgi:hypothetical protein